MDLRTRATAKKRRRLMEKVVGRNGGEKRSELPTVTVATISSQSSKQTGEDDTEKPGKLARRYELHGSRNGFFFGGRILTGGDSPWAFIACLCVVFGFAGLWFGTTGVWWWREAGRARVAISLGDPPPVGLDGFDFARRPVGTVGVEGRDWSWVTVDANARRAGKAIVIVCAYMAAVVISSMMVTAFSDPGILPRGLDPDPPYPATSPSDGGVRTPMPRDLKVRDDVVRVKYCPTCKTYRPPRASHCKMVTISLHKI
jgi:palmitoyltransferase ZDHHC9/14/18